LFVPNVQTIMCFGSIVTVVDVSDTLCHMGLASLFLTVSETSPSVLLENMQSHCKVVSCSQQSVTMSVLHVTSRHGRGVKRELPTRDNTLPCGTASLVDVLQVRHESCYRDPFVQWSTMTDRCQL